jgi:predicted RNA-binding Zn ribbon-like protein
MESTDAVADEAFLLDLLNSTPIVDGTPRDELDTGRAGRAWLRAHGYRGSAGEWHAVRATRAALQAVVRGQQPAVSLGPLLDEVSYRPSVSDDGVRWRLDAPADRTAAVRAVLAWDALRRTRPGRLRACENSDCALFLIDRSKPNKARWCSMAVCGNRMKARRHYERIRTNVDGGDD